MATYPLISCLPFMGLLTSLSFCPLLLPRFWQKYENWVITMWGLLACFFVVFYSPSIEIGTHTIMNELLNGYIPFIIAVGSLYIVSTGINIDISYPPKSFTLTIFLGAGAILSNFIGTTGASILLIHPLIKLIQNRTHKTHVIVFFIFLVSNCGGCLTPLGDPPLFMGVLQGIHFCWSLKNLWQPFLFTSCSLLTLFYILDYALTYKEQFKTHREKYLKLKGLPHLFILLTILSIFFALGLIEDNGNTILGLSRVSLKHIGSVLIIFQTILSLILKRKQAIHWEPIQEVTLIFFVVFIALIPIMNLLEAENINFVRKIKYYLNIDGSPNAFNYFWICGFCSAFLDNAPTYLIFFKMTGKNPSNLMNESNLILKAISLGSVFMGAFTYLGNAPNLIVRSIVISSGLRIPSFLGYILYAIMFLIPIFIITSILFL